MGKSVHLALVGKIDLWPSYGTHRAGKNVIGVNSLYIDRYVRDIVRAGGKHEAVQAHQCTAIHERTCVPSNMHLHCCQVTILRCTGFVAQREWMAFGVGEYRFLTRTCEKDGTLRVPCE